MKKLLITIVLIFIIIAITMIALTGTKNPVATINGKTFDVDVAKTTLQKEKGLAIYDSLPQDKGMVFPFTTSDYRTFWMKDMKFPIDIIYINQGKIIDIYSSVPAPKSPNSPLPIYKSKSPANLVLEINAGLSQKYNFKVGDSVTTNF